MWYAVRSLSGDEASETLAAHVLARAYQAAWRARYGQEPLGSLVLAELDLVIEFMEPNAIPDDATPAMP